MSWNDMFVNMGNTNFFNFSFLPKYAGAFVRGFEYTLLLAVVSVLLAVIPALLLALMRLSKNRFIKTIAGAYIALFRSTPPRSKAANARSAAIAWIKGVSSTADSL